MTPSPGKRPLRGKRQPEPVKLTRTEKERRQRLDAVVMAASAWWFRGIEMRTPILCVRPWRRGMRSCFQRVHVRIDAPDGPIRHVCEGCRHVGWIENWQDSDLDLSGITIPDDGTWMEVVLCAPQQRELMGACAASPHVMRVLAAASAVETDAIVAGPRCVIEEMLDLCTAALRKTRSKKRKEFLTVIWEWIDAALTAQS